MSFRPSVAPLPNSAGRDNRNDSSQQQYSDDPSSILRLYYNKTTARQASFDPIYNNIYEDKTLQELSQETENFGGISENYFKQHAGTYAIKFLEGVVHYRMGEFHNMFMSIINNYGRILNENDMAKMEFAKLIKNRLDLGDRIGTNSSLWFGRGCMNVLKKQQENNGGFMVPRAEMFRIAEASIIQIMNLEFVMWITGSRKGKNFLYNPTPAVKHLLETTPQRQKYASIVFPTFDLANPYEAMDLGTGLTESIGSTDILPELAGTSVRQYIGDVPGLDGPNGDLIRLGMEHAQAYGKHVPLNRPPRRDVPEELNEYHDRNKDSMSNRTDLMNLTLGNRNQFNLRSYFTPTAVPGWYTIAENDWLLIQDVLRKHPLQRLEESMFAHCVRLVNYDFDNEINSAGWTSRSISFREVDPQMFLTDPAKLIPLLEAEAPEPHERPVCVVDAKEFFDRQMAELNGEEFKFEEGRDPGYVFKVLLEEKPFVDDSSVRFIEKLNVTSKMVSERTTEPTAVITDTNITGRLLVDTQQKRDNIIKYFPILFKENDQILKTQSYFGAVESIIRAFSKYQIDEEGHACIFENVVNGRLSNDFNNWLINSCGYALPSMKQGKLSTNNLLADIKELKTILMKTDPEVYELLNTAGSNISLMKQMQFLEKIKELDEGADPVELESNLLSLGRRRKYITISIANMNGPKYPVAKPYVMKRSVQPELFALIDTVDKRLKEEGDSWRNVDIFLTFPLSASLFLVNGSVYDENTLIMRSVMQNRTFLAPAYAE